MTTAINCRSCSMWTRRLQNIRASWFPSLGPSRSARFCPSASRENFDRKPDIETSSQTQIRTARHALSFAPGRPVSNMSSDSDYMSFLKKANQDPATAVGQVEVVHPKKQEFRTVDEGETIPDSIKIVTTDRFYTSDADEPFVPVCLRWDEGSRQLPDEGTPRVHPQHPTTLFLVVVLADIDGRFSNLHCTSVCQTEQLAKLIGHDSPGEAEKLIDILDAMAWDPNGKYSDVTQAVAEATKGSPVMVYKIHHGHGSTRVEYWVLSSVGSGKQARLVGAKVLAIES